MRLLLVCAIAVALLLMAWPLVAGSAPQEDSPGRTQPTAGPVYPTPDDPGLRSPDSPVYKKYLVYDEAYYAKVDTTRLYVTRPHPRGAPPKPHLRAISSRVGEGRPGTPFEESLRVVTRPDMPVTFFAPDWGTFDNAERTITVQADSRGVASVTFNFGKRAGAYRALAHSPEAIGWAVFHLEAR